VSFNESAEFVQYSIPYCEFVAVGSYIKKKPKRIEETLISTHKSSKLFLKNNPNTIFTHTKGNITVTMNKTLDITKRKWKSF